MIDSIFLHCFSSPFPHFSRFLYASRMPHARWVYGTNNCGFLLTALGKISW